MLKIVLMCCVIAACTLCGCSMSAAAVARWEFLAKWVLGLRKLRLNIVESAMPIGQALKLSDFQMFEKVSEYISRVGSLSEAWQIVSAENRVMKGLSESELAVMGNLFDQLGISGRMIQDEMIRSCIHILEESLHEAKTRAVQVSKLYTSLGFLIGLAIVILMI